MSHQDWKPVTFPSRPQAPQTKQITTKPNVTEKSAKNNKLDSGGDIPEKSKKPVKKYGLQIKQIREAKGLNQKAFASVLSLSPSVIQDYECDKIQPEGKIRERIQRMFKIRFQ